MTVIACLQLPRKRHSAGTPPASSMDAALDLCAQLTPVVEPDGEQIWMDWTGCGAVPALVEKLASGLARLTGAGTDSPAGSSLGRARYRLGVAPLRFVAGAVAAGGVAVEDVAFAIDTPVLLGFRVTDGALPEVLAALRIRALPEIDAEVRDALRALGVRTLGELARFPRDLLYDHVGPAADRLLDWARGQDPRRVRALYPPERLERRISMKALGLAGGLQDDWLSLSSGGSNGASRGEPTGELSGVGAVIDAARLKTIVSRVAEELAAELAASRRACAALTITAGRRRLKRSFTTPVTAPDQLGRIILHMLRRLLSDAPSSDHSTIRFSDDFVITVTPVLHAGQQMTLFALDRPGAPAKRKKLSVLEHPALAAVRARFGHLFRFNTLAGEANFRLWNGRGGSEPSNPQGDGCDGATRRRDAVAHYEAMCRFYA